MRCFGRNAVILRAAPEESQGELTVRSFGFAQDDREGLLFLKFS